MTFSNFALRYHKDIEHWVIYHLKDVLEMCRRSLNHFSRTDVISCGVVVDVNVNFDTLTRELHDRNKCVGGCSCGKMSG